MDNYHDGVYAGSDLEYRPRYGSAGYGGDPGPQNSGQPTPPSIAMHASSSSNGAGMTSPPDQLSGGSSAVPTPGPGQSGPRRMSTSSRLEGKDEPIGFDEGILRGLCDMDCALPLLADRIKQSIATCKQVGIFFRQRADVEEKYSRGLTEVARTSNEVYGKADCKAGSFVASYQAALRLQEQLAQNRLRFSQRLYEMSEEMFALGREGERQRKQHKDNGTRLQNILQDSETVMDKAKGRFDQTAEELERILVAKEGESFRDAGMRSANAASAAAGNGVSQSSGKKGIGKAMTKGLFKGKNPAQMAKHEDDVRARMASTSEAFRKACLESQALRQEYFNHQLPRIVRALKDCADELDNGMQYHLTRYAYMYESTVVSEGTLLSPRDPEDAGMKAIFDLIDNRSDFKAYMQNYSVARNTPRGPRREGPYDEGYLPPISNGNGNLPQPPPQTGTSPASTADMYVSPGVPANSGATFGVDLGDQLARDGTEVPKVVVKCAEAIEAYGLDSVGIYRLSGTTSKVTALKNALDKDIDGVDIMDEAWSSDINEVSGALKLWFRELPEPLLTYGLYHGFIEAAKKDIDRLRHIRLHEQVNDLPDPNYATLKYFMGHLDKVRRHEGVNQMSASNLSIVFGPTLLGAPPEEGGLRLEDMSYQCKAIETILEKYQEIFVEEEDEDEDGAAQAQ
ncbi:hypothetical protein CspeluHIS016_0205750 [Cutaneotrichosporon spelunceum]|uniref:Rho-GAP domain-containing protein n=1 Tax=Cutaneotrichosporon spelunceum TaxID=1672016 RepID=A0AAD3TRX6_9TREE|nr:hypothetical protein CspeluHIS016_0205750 [Cutaneotrichosporon spelunceum]